MARDIRAGRAFVELGTNNSKFNAGLKAAAARLNNFGNSALRASRAFAGIGTALVAPLGLALNRFASFGDTIGKTAARTGASVEAIAALGFAAQQSGSDLATLEKGFFGLSRSILDAERGSAATAEAFAALGLSVADIAGQSPEAQFTAVAEALSKVEDASTQGALAQQLFGRAGRQLLPLLSQGRAGLEAFAKELEQLGGIFSPEDIKAAEALTDAINRVKIAVQAVVFRVGASLAPAFTTAANSIASSGKALGDFIDRNRAAIVGVALLGGVSLAASAALASIGVAAKIASVGLLTLTRVPKLLASGFAIAVVAGSALGVGLLRLTGQTGLAVNTLRAAFGTLIETARQTFGGIADALTAGDVQAAVQILWAGIRVEFLKGKQFLQEIWAGVKLFAAEALLSTADFANLSVALIRRSFASLSTSLLGYWADFKNSGSESLNLLVLQVDRLKNRIQALFDDGFDLSAADDQAARRFVDSQQGGQSEQRAEQARIESQFDTELAEIDSARQEVQNTIDGLRKSAPEAIAAEAAEALKRTRAELAEARAELDRSTAAAGEAAAEAAARVAEGVNLPDFESLADALAGVPSSVARNIAGIFDARGVAGLAGGPSQFEQRTAAATEEAARVLRRIEPKLGDTRFG